MLGYITPDKPDLRIKEYEIYGAYYCGICKSIGRRYGQIPRMALSYDSVFLALLLAGIDPAPDSIKIERCIVHPFKKRSIAYGNPAIDYAADILLLLAYFKLRDDYQDEKRLTAAAGAALMKGIIRKLTLVKKEKTRIVTAKLEELSVLEKESCGSIDRSAEPFAGLMEEVFDAENQLPNEETRQIYKRIGYHIGKWIYLIDAFDDIEENIKNNGYNVLIRQFEFFPGQESVDEFKLRIRDRIERNLMLYLAETAKCCKQLELKKNQGLIENILYFGLLRKTEEVLQKGMENHAESL